MVQSNQLIKMRDPRHHTNKWTKGGDCVCVCVQEAHKNGHYIHGENSSWVIHLAESGLVSALAVAESPAERVGNEVR